MWPRSIGGQKHAGVEAFSPGRAKTNLEARNVKVTMNAAILSRSEMFCGHIECGDLLEARKLRGDGECGDLLTDSAMAMVGANIACR